MMFWIRPGVTVLVLTLLTLLAVGCSCSDDSDGSIDNVDGGADGSSQRDDASAQPDDATLDAPSQQDARPDATVYVDCVSGEPIELTPVDVSSAQTNVFDPLPSADPARFGFGEGEIRVVNFDTAPGNVVLAANTELSDEYSELGVTMNNIRIDSAVYEGPASAPNATEDNAPQHFTFAVPVVAVGVINTSPDQDTVEVWSEPDGTGDLLADFRDQNEEPAPNFHIDRFVGVRCQQGVIGSFVVYNESGDLELDELVFELASP